MNRRVLASLLAIATVGCARDRIEMSPGEAAIRARQAPPAGIAPLDPIRASINQGKIPADPNMSKAGGLSQNPPVNSPPDAPTDPGLTRAGLNAEDSASAAKPANPPAPKKPNMAGEGTIGSDAPDVPVSDPKPGTIFNRKPKTPPTPVPAASPATGGTADAKTARPASNMGTSAPGTDLGGVTTPEPVAAEVPENPDKPATTEQAANPATPVADPKAADGDRLAIPTADSLAPGKQVAAVIAKVGDTLITARELRFVTLHRLAEQGVDPSDASQITPEQLDNYGKNMLEDMINNTLIIQDFRRDLKKPEMWKQFSEGFEKEWHEKEVPRLCKKYHKENELAFSKALESYGETLDDWKEAFLMEEMGHELMRMKVRSKVSKPVMIDMEAYYRKHLHDFDRAAGIKWREIFLPAAAPVSGASVRKKAEELRSRILKGEKFEAVAKAESAGASAKKGGDWGWSQPGAYGVPQVNAVLKALPVGKVSEPIETPRGVYLVKVEGRRNAGPAPFIEVQKEIATKVFEQEFQKEIEAYLDALRKKTVIRKYKTRPESRL